LRDLVRTENAFRLAHPGQPFPDTLAGAQTVAMGHARWQAARQDARRLDSLVRGAETAGESPEYVAALVRARDGALSRAIGAQEELTGVWQRREATRAEHLATHGPAVLAEQPAGVPTGPMRTDAWGADGRHAATGTRFDEAGFDREGFDRRGWDHLGYNRSTGTQWNLSGHNAAGEHYSEVGLTSADARPQTADDVVNGTMELEPVGKRTSAARAIADAKRSEKADAQPAKVAAPAPAPVVVAPQRERLALYAQWNERDQLVSDAEARELLGVDQADLERLTAEGRMPVAVDASRLHPRMHELGSVLDVAAELPAPPARVTRAMLQDHTQWRRAGEAHRLAAWREREAEMNRAKTHWLAA